ncbi:hypothetical protein ACUODF_49900, partial [Escherichia coli]
MLFICICLGYIPCTLFETISLFDDFSADDMQYGD